MNKKHRKLKLVYVCVQGCKVDYSACAYRWRSKRLYHQSTSSASNGIGNNLQLASERQILVAKLEFFGCVCAVQIGQIYIDINLISSCE